MGEEAHSASTEIGDQELVSSSTPGEIVKPGLDFLEGLGVDHLCLVQIDQ